MRQNLKLCGTVGILLLLVQAGWADVSHDKRNASGRQVLADAPYLLNLQSCPFRFKSRPGAYVGRDPSNTQRGGYSDENFEGQVDLSISFRCVEEPVSQQCPKVVEVTDSDPTTLQMMQVRHYKRIHPLYEGSAVATNMTAVNPPRPRALDFCLGDERRTIVGRSIVGNERRAYVQQVLRIISSIRFTDGVKLPGR